MNVITAALVLTLAGCGRDAVDDSAGDTATPPAREVTRFFGTSDGRTPDGSYTAPSEELLFVRTLDPVASTVKEDAWSVDDRGNVDSYSLVHDVDVAAGTFTSAFVTSAGTLQVDGSFDSGDAWAWTAWHSHSTYQDGEYAGSSIDSHDTRDAQSGVIIAEKTFVDAGGTTTYFITEALTPTDDASFAARLAEIGG